MAKRKKARPRTGTRKTKRGSTGKSRARLNPIGIAPAPPIKRPRPRYIDMAKVDQANSIEVAKRLSS